ncbi:single-minded homolog 1-A-like [Babylonia areolata]|uniref:single-minded homolog 1-A-like n=1 Tax=Babylonia areolata TaxID=304850 RepID=UPI003FD39BA4
MENNKTPSRTRREKENSELQELAKLLPLPSAITVQLDKATTVRLTVACLRLRSFFPRGVADRQDRWEVSRTHLQRNLGAHFLQNLDGFVFVVAPDGKILYISETVSVHLGLSQKQAAQNSTSNGKDDDDNDDDEYQTVGLVGVGRSVPPSLLTRLPLDCHAFVFRASLDLHFLYLDSRGREMTGYEEQEVMTLSVYQLIHPCDLPTLIHAHHTLLTKGQVTTKYYRFLTKAGGWRWVQSFIFLVRGPGDCGPDCAVSVNYVLSGVMNKDSQTQLEPSGVRQPTESDRSGPPPNAKRVNSIAARHGKPGSPGPRTKPRPYPLQQQHRTPEKKTLDSARQETEADGCLARLVTPSSRKRRCELTGGGVTGSNPLSCWVQRSPHHPVALFRVDQARRPEAPVCSVRSKLAPV